MLHGFDDLDNDHTRSLLRIVCLDMGRDFEGLDDPVIGLCIAMRLRCSAVLWTIGRRIHSHRLHFRRGTAATVLRRIHNHLSAGDDVTQWRLRNGLYVVLPIRRLASHRKQLHRPQLFVLSAGWNSRRRSRVPDQQHGLLFSSTASAAATTSGLYRILRLGLGTNTKHLGPHFRQLQRRWPGRLCVRTTELSRC